ncbi:DUF2971 domain-containing protein [Parabacteroides sp. TM07-1AC]|uniref:DUF2971 domain-containing protein n=1 Tax=Parabacteroides sp. TM07-1AC TaxID=2292363 RepID=UPI000F00FA94|nr:DUF2971 domain-containing protein [Parabacteroides sp. TM07-1AC]RHU25218.1 DUF2971 domain-containing protein [Parabacteroides sp. TM07-1AC]
MNGDDRQLLAKVLERKDEKLREDWQEIQRIVDSCVFHYTNAGTLASMLNNTSKEKILMTFWASHISYMNDPEEIEYGVGKMWEVLPDVEKELSIPIGQRITELDRKELDELIWDRNIEENSLTNMYSVSFSKSFDSLPMWNMYGQNGSGVCLGFDLNELNDFLNSNNKEPLMKITYGVGEYIDSLQKADEEMNIWKEYVKHVYKTNMNFIVGNFKMETEVQENVDTKIALDNYMLLRAFVPSNIKNPAYKYEDEYRFCCREFNNKVNYRNRNGLLLPYIEVKLPLTALKLVAIGPTADKNRQMMLVAKLLKEKASDFKSLTFYSSEIPYRL